MSPCNASVAWMNTEGVPVLLSVAAIFIAIIYVGADAMSRAIDVPTYLADVIVATTVLAVLIGLVLVRYRVVMRG